ncbi:MAG: PKD domain-containing protein [Saprospiraceae bacterium]|nr:PKD domain-containing protein [Saprospiraceae bacterium]
MRPNFFLPALFTLLSTVLLTAQDWNAAKRYSAPPASTLTNTSIAASPDGSTYLTGTIRGTVVFDDLTAATPDNTTTRHYLLKLNQANKAEWVQLFEPKANHVTTDAQGNVFVAGTIEASPTTGDSLTYLAKYSAGGQLLATFQTSGVGKSWARVVRTDAAGNCYVAGGQFGTVTYGPYSLSAIGGEDGYLLKLSPNLSQVEWVVSTGSSSKRDQVFDIRLDNNGSVYTSGHHGQTYSGFPFGCYCWSGSFFVEKRSTTGGTLFWQKKFTGGSGSSTRLTIALEPSAQRVFAVASFKHTTTFAPGISLTAESGTDDYHIWATALTASSGTVEWAKKIAWTGDNYPIWSAVADNHLFMFGSFVSTALFGTFILSPQGNADPFFAKVSLADGTVAHAESFVGASGDNGISMDARPNKLVVGGNTSSATLTIGNHNSTGTTNSVFIAQKLFVSPLGLQLLSATQASCPGAFDGSATVGAVGGVPPFSYSWSNGQTGPTADDLAPGIYGVTATDASGQSQALEVIVSAANQIPQAGFTYHIEGTTIHFANTSSGGATAYQWDFGDGVTSNSSSTSISHTYTLAGTYTVRLTAQNICGSSVIEQIVGIVATQNHEWLGTSRLFPNPNRGVFTLELNGEATEDIEIALYDLEGKMLHREIANFKTGMLTRQFDYPELPSGLYLLRISAGQRASMLKMVIQQ